MVHPLLKYWSSIYFKITAYLNNGLGNENTKESSLQESKEVLSDLLYAGWFFFHNYDFSPQKILVIFQNKVCS